jgi:hypothetical protein
MLDRFKIAGTTVCDHLALYATPTSAMEVTTIGSQLVRAAASWTATSPRSRMRSGDGRRGYNRAA